MRFSIRAIALAAVIAAVSSGCAQDPNRVVISVGRGLNMFSDGVKPDGNEVRDYAAFYLPYAMMSRLAYVEKRYLLSNGCPNEALMAAPPLSAPQEEREEHLMLSKHAKIRGWSCVKGWFAEVPNENGGATQVPGFAAYVWTKGDGRGGCRIAIAFRGSDNEWADWRSNLRLLLPFTTYPDQYDYVHSSIHRIIASAKCRPSRVVMTGHSLGAGLAQAGAFVHGNTDYVFAFDSSPMTTFLELNPKSFERQYGKLAVDRIYEVGEVLQAVRYVLHGFSNPRLCQPRTRLVRFNLTPGFNPFGQHRSEALVNNFKKAAGGFRLTDAALARVDGQLRAKNCNFIEDFQNYPYRN